jgi:hypothetical protein
MGMQPRETIGVDRSPGFGLRMNRQAVATYPISGQMAPPSGTLGEVAGGAP